MRRLKVLFVLLVLGVVTYVAATHCFTGLKVRGYSYLLTSKESYDLVIKYALIIDGTGENEKYRGDIALRDGYIAGVGFINPQDSPVFDAGGLTVIPAPIEIIPGGDVVVHPLNYSYPRYPAESIILCDPPYQGVSLEQAAHSRGIGITEMYKLLNHSNPHATVLLAPLEFAEGHAKAEELLARLTGYRAAALGYQERGTIEAGKKADFYIVRTRDCPDEQLINLLKKGQMPAPVYRVEGGAFINQ